MEEMPRAPASSGSSSVLTFAKVMSGLASAAFSKTGAKRMQGPHQEAQKSTRVMPSPRTVELNSLPVMVVRAMGLPFGSTAADRDNGYPRAVYSGALAQARG